MTKREMRSYLSLIPISAKVRRKQNRLILLCIIFAVFLVTTVFSYAEIMTAGEAAVMVRKHGRYHIAVSGVSEEEAEQIKTQENVSAAAWFRSFGEDIYEGYLIGDKRVVLYGATQAYIEDIRKYQWEGVYPQNDREVMLNGIARERLGVQAGDSVTIHTPAGDFDYTVTGFCVDEWQLYNEKYDGVCAYMNMDALAAICSANGYPDGSGGNDTGDGSAGPVLYVQFVKGTDIKEAVAGLKDQYGLSDANIQENKITMGMEGASSNQTINWLYGMAAAVFVMILIAGVLMISSCMNSTVSQRVKFFGMMRCIGASKEQVMRFVCLEALNWCKSAIPVGLGISVVFTWALSEFLQRKVGGEFSDYSFRFSMIGIMSGIWVGIITVLLAAHSPARRAAGVSPVAAVSGNVQTARKLTRPVHSRVFRVESALGVYHAAAVKKNLILMSLSFAFTVTLFLVFFAVLDFARKLLPSESDLNPDISVASIDNTNSLDRNLKAEMVKLPGVTAAFGSAMQFTVPAEINGMPGSVDLVSYDDYMFQWTKDSVISGDLSKVVGDTDYVFTIFNQDSRLNTGDIIRIGETDLEIVCVVSEGIGTRECPVVCTEETFRRITGEENYMVLNVQLTKDAPEETVDAIRSMIGENELEDSREESEVNNSSFWVFRIAAYGFLCIIALITIFNIMNNISMSVSAKMKQYGAMRAVGMSIDQMIKMIAMEAATYAACGLVIGYAGGLYLHRLIMNKLVYAHFGGSWKVPVEPLTIITLIVILSCVAAVRSPARKIRDMAITETINEL